MVVSSSVATFLGAMARHGARSLRSGGFPALFATMMVAVGALALSVYATLVLNIERVGLGVGRSVAAVAFLDVRSAAEAEEVRATCALEPRVAEARLISPEAALARARHALGDAARGLDGSAGIHMPWVVEVAPRAAQDVDVAALLAALRAIKGVEEVVHPSADVARVEALLRLLHGGGLVLGGLLAAVVVLVVSNALKIAVFHRRDEIAVLKLVGATDAFVRVPFLVSGGVQGLVGAGLGLAGLVALHATLDRLAGEVLASAAGAFTLVPLPAAHGGALVVGGGVLGVVGAALAVGRFVRV